MSGKKNENTPRRGGKAEKQAAPPETTAPVNKPVEQLASFWLRFERFGVDIVGVGVLAGALITLLGLAKLSRGSFMTPWVSLLTRAFGWGSFLVIGSIGALGIMILMRRVSRMPNPGLQRILALEGLIFSALAVLSAAGGHILENAENGQDGGLVGWGLAELTGMVLSNSLNFVVWFVLATVFGLIGFGAIAPLVRWLDRVLSVDETQMPEPEQALADDFPSVAEADEDQRTVEVNLGPRDLGAFGDEEEALQAARDERLPPLNILTSEHNNHPDEANIHATATRLEHALAEFGIPARVMGYRVGPTVTQFAVEPGYIEKVGPDGQPQRQKVRVSQISNLARDLALALSAERLRIEAPVPGESFVGIEVPNEQTSMVRLRPLLETTAFQKLKSPLGLVLGRDVSGQPVVADLARMPHMLVAGTTGSGKSVCIAAITACLVMNNTPENLKIAMLDPKMVELVRFNGLPHLLGKVETEEERMLGVLRWALGEMDARYRLLEASHARNLETYNKRMERRKQTPLPRIVILIDELADLMMAAPDQTEHAIVRLAQLARAVGIHLVVATQRPSTDVVTGLIKANFPARISFTVASSIDSRVILDTSGAETLLGRGDMLFLNPEVGVPHRAQGVMISDQEIDRIIQIWQKLSAPVEAEAPWEQMVQSEEAGPDQLIEQAIKVVRSTQRASASMLQRRLRVGYPRAARLIDELEEMGIIGPAQVGGRERQVLVPREDEDDELGNGNNGYSGGDE